MVDNSKLKGLYEITSRHPVVEILVPVRKTIDLRDIDAKEAEWLLENGHSQLLSKVANATKDKSSDG